MEKFERMLKEFQKLPDHKEQRKKILDWTHRTPKIDENGNITELRWYHSVYQWVEKTDRWVTKYTILEIDWDGKQSSVTFKDASLIDETFVFDHPIHMDSEEFDHLKDLHAAHAWAFGDVYDGAQPIYYGIMVEVAFRGFRKLLHKEDKFPGRSHK